MKPRMEDTVRQSKHSLIAPRTGTLASGLKHYWYAVGFAAKMGPATLKPFKLFDQSWLLFRGAQGQVGCIKDECAHRACPLSLGTMVNGTVQCGYHGWQYDTQGTCTNMPSCKLGQATVPSLPCLEAGGLIWVWPSPTTPSAPPQNLLETVPKGFHVHAEIEIELPVEHGLMVENLLDLAHAPFTHASTFAKGWPVPEVVRFLTLPKSPLTGHWDPYPIHMSFEPPCYVRSTIGLRGRDCGKHLHQFHCCLPAGTGHTRLLYRLSLDCFQWARSIPGKHWVWRQLAQRVINEDLRLIVGQQQRLAEGGDVWNQPVSYDKLGISYRRWRNQIEVNSPEWSVEPDDWNNRSSLSSQLNCE